MELLKAKSKITVVKNGIELKFEAAEEGGYTVSVPDLPGCISEGDTFEEALSNIEDAIRGWLLVAQKYKRFLLRTAKKHQLSA